MPVGGKDTEQFVISSERQQQQRADATLDNALAHRGATIAVIGHGVSEMDNPLAPQDAFEYAAFRRTERTLLPPIIGKGGLAVSSGKTEPFRLPDEQITVSRPAKGMRLFENCIEYRREIAGRGIDDLQHLGGRGLLLQSLSRLG